jgi:hypothetical protein
MKGKAAGNESSYSGKNHLLQKSKIERGIGKFILTPT